MVTWILKMKDFRIKNQDPVTLKCLYLNTMNLAIIYKIEKFVTYESQKLDQKVIGWKSIVI